MAMTRRRPFPVVAAPRPHDLVNLLLHQRAQHTQPDTHTERQQPLLRDTGQLAQRLLHPGGQHLLRRRLGDRYGPLHGGSSFDLWTDHRERCQQQQTRRRDRRPTKFYELRDNLLFPLFAGEKRVGPKGDEHPDRYVVRHATDGTAERAAEE